MNIYESIPLYLSIVPLIHVAEGQTGTHVCQCNGCNNMSHKGINTSITSITFLNMSLYLVIKVIFKENMLLTVRPTEIILVLYSFPAKNNMDCC